MQTTPVDCQSKEILSQQRIRCWRSCRVCVLPMK